jgi:hypothetical protein
VKTGDNENGIGFDAKKEAVWEILYQGAAQFAEDDRELQGVESNTRYGGVNLRAEAAAESGRLRVVPILRGDDFSPRGLSENDGRR